jgi:hypothetical protein
LISIKNLPARGLKVGEASRRIDDAAARSCGHADLRCGCGSLLAKLVSGAVELKCRRCKQTWRIPLEAG